MKCLSLTLSVTMWRILLNVRLRLEVVTAEYITEILFRKSVFLVHPLLRTGESFEIIKHTHLLTSCPTRTDS